MNAFRRLILPLIFAGLLFSACIPAMEAPPTPEPVTLRFAFIGSQVDYQDLVERFREEYPWITIDLVGLNNLQRGLDPLYTEFETADVVRANAAFLDGDQLALVRPLDEFVSADTALQAEDVFPGLMEAGQLNGQQMALPAGIDPMVMFYENARFRVANATPPGPDYTLDGFLAAAQSVHNPDEEVRSEGRYSVGFCTSPFGNDPFIIAGLFGGDTFDRTTEPYTPTLNSQANVDAVRWYASLWTDYQVAPPVEEDQYDMYSLIEQQLVWLLDPVLRYVRALLGYDHRSTDAAPPADRLAQQPALVCPVGRLLLDPELTAPPGSVAVDAISHDRSGRLDHVGPAAALTDRLR